MSPIQCAVLAGHRDIVQELAKGFADVNSVNEVSVRGMQCRCTVACLLWHR